MNDADENPAAHPFSCLVDAPAIESELTSPDLSALLVRKEATKLAMVVHVRPLALDTFILGIRTSAGPIEEAVLENVQVPLSKSLGIPMYWGPQKFVGAMAIHVEASSSSADASIHWIGIAFDGRLLPAWWTSRSPYTWSAICVREHPGTLVLHDHFGLGVILPIRFEAPNTVLVRFADKARRIIVTKLRRRTGRMSSAS